MFTTAFHTFRHFATHSLIAASVAVAGLTAAPSMAQAQSFVSVKNNNANVRAQPNAKSEVKWELGKGYPLQVTAKQGNWLRVRDYESTLGWVAKSSTHNQAHHVVKSRVANMRSGPAANTHVVGKLEQHEVVRTMEKRSGWVKVRTTAGKQGWVASNLLWGW